MAGLLGSTARGISRSTAPRGSSAPTPSTCLELAVVTRRARVPLICSVLDNNGGAGDSRERIALMRRYLRRRERSAAAGGSGVRRHAWASSTKTIPVATRLKETMKEKLTATTEDAAASPSATLHDSRPFVAR